MPVIPPESAYTEAELRFIDAQPPGLWPENQDSNFGQIRKVLTDNIQARVDELAMLEQEHFVPTSTRYLSLWEEMLGVPVAVAGKTDAQRRAVLETRLEWGAFTHSQRSRIIESYLAPTISVGGTPVTFLPSGVPIGAGVPLYGGGGPVATKYRVYEDQANFSYLVWIDSGNVPDLNALTRELKRVTPAGISFTIDTSKTGTALIHWGNTVKGLGPSGWWGLDTTYNDSSGLGHNGTVTGAPTAIAAPGLLPGVLGTDAARDFSGTAQYVTIADSPRLNPNELSIHTIVRPDSLPTAGNYRIAYYAGGTGNNATWIGVANYAGTIRFMVRVWNGTSFVEAVGATLPVVGTTYRLAATYDGQIARLFVNGIQENTAALAGPISLTGTKYIGVRGPADAYFWDGGLDEILVFGFPLSQAQITYLNKQATNTL